MTDASDPERSKRSASSKQRGRRHNPDSVAALRAASEHREALKQRGEAIDFTLYEKIASETIARKERGRANRCMRCWHDRAQRCICEHLPSDLATRLPIKVLVLQHYKEYLSAGDDAKLLLAMLPADRAELYVHGRKGDWDRLEAELSIDPAHCLLLWPGDGAATVESFVEALPSASPWRQQRQASLESDASTLPLMRIVVLDSVYNSARSMFRFMRKRLATPPAHVALHPNTLSVYHRATKGYATSSTQTVRARPHRATART